jgi:ribosomal protein S6--L-glutamate ligase
LIRGCRIELWVEERGGNPAVNPIMRSLLRTLAADGAQASVRVPEREVHDPADPLRMPDLVLLKSATDLAISRAVAAEAAGVICLNGASVTRRAHDKAAAVATLAAAGLPVPCTYMLQVGAETPSVPAEGEGWVAKPVRGVHGSGVTFHDSLSEALAPPPGTEADGSFVADDGTRLVQRRVGGEEQDLKVYVADGRCFAGRKRFSADSYATDEIERVGLDEDTRGVVLGAGEALGMSLFGVDLRFDGGRPAIIDANPFPGYRGCPEAVEALRAEVGRVMESACR